MNIRLPALLTFLLVLVLGFGFLFKTRFFPTVPELFAGNRMEGDTQEQKLTLPEVSPIKEVSQLDSLMYDVKRGESEEQGRVDTVAPSLQPAVRQDTAPRLVATPPPKETINTSEPVETEKIRNLVEHSHTRYDDLPPAPRFPDSDASRAHSREPTGLDPRDLDEERRFDSQRAQSWEGGQRYEILINTSVMDHPSFHANEVAELFVGDRVLVEARLGRWLRVRSVKGKPGYIMAQDAQKLFD